MISMVDRLQLLDKYVVPECTGDKEVAFGIAKSPEDRLGRLRVTTDAYSKRGYLQGIPEIGLNISFKDLMESGLDNFISLLSREDYETFMEKGIFVYDLYGNITDGVYIDPWEFQSIPIVAKISTGEVVASSRLIMANDPLPLPTLKSEKLVNPDFKDLVRLVPLEMSQLAKSETANDFVKFGLFRIAILLSRELGTNEWLATTDSFVMKLLNGKLKFAIKEIGENQMYLGSKSTPGWIRINYTIENVKKNGNPNLAAYLDGETGVPGFEVFISL